jgi:uncharacterized membrane protein
MEEKILLVVSELSLILGLLGIFIILVGAGRGAWKFMNPKVHTKLRLIRMELGSHTILGLDFLVGKDIIDTLLLNVEDLSIFYANLIGLFAVVMIRIILTYFTGKELKEIRVQEKLIEKRRKK